MYFVHIANKAWHGKIWKKNAWSEKQSCWYAQKHWSFSRASCFIPSANDLAKLSVSIINIYVINLSIYELGQTFHVKNIYTYMVLWYQKCNRRCSCDEMIGRINGADGLGAPAAAKLTRRRITKKSLRVAGRG